MSEINGWMGQIAEIDLTTGNASTIPTIDYAREYVGGRGIAARLYWDRVASETEALSPDNALIVMGGPMVNTPAFAFNRVVIYGKSPMLYPEQAGMASLSGSIPRKLKSAGFDGLIVKGRAAVPSYIYVDDGQISILPADELWGLDTEETLGRLEDKHGDGAGIMCIGPAGEHQVRFAVIASHNGSFASRGFGAVLGSKRIKAIVFNGKQRAKVADRKRLVAINKEILGIVAPNTSKSINFMMFKMILKKDYVRHSSCRGCPTGCDRALFRDKKTGREEVRKLCASMTPYVEWERKNKAQKEPLAFDTTSLLNRYGLCTIEMSKLLKLIELSVKAGDLSEDVLGEQISEMGNWEFFESIVAKVTHLEGYGSVLAQGAIRTAQEIGGQSPEIVRSILSRSGFNITNYDPRFFPPTAILHATDPYPRTALHEIGTPMLHWCMWRATFGFGAKMSTQTLLKASELFWGGKEAIDFSTYAGKDKMTNLIQNRAYAKETMVGCDFFYPIIGSEKVRKHVGDPTVEARLLSAVTGIEYSQDDYMRLGERVFNLQRAILLREGHDGRADDVLPNVVFKEPWVKDETHFGSMNPKSMVPGPGGKQTSRKGQMMDRDTFKLMLDEYYQERGWDVETGYPSKEHLQELSLDYVVADLSKLGKVRN